MRADSAGPLRSEDAPLVTGRGRFIADINRDGQVWARIVRSPVAHGNLMNVDLTAARKVTGVLGAFSAQDLNGIADANIPVRISSTEWAEWCLQPPLARGRVNYVGEPVAVVVATDPYIAEDAAHEVWAEIEEMKPLLDPLVAQSSPPLHTNLDSNVIGKRVAESGEDIEKVLRSADVVIRRQIRSHRHTAVPMETRGLLSEVDSNGHVTVWGATKVKHFNRRALAELLRVPESHIRLIETEVGGSFGVRGEMYPEDLLIPWLALKLARPVKWVEDRAEHFIATNHSREHIFDIEVGATSEGRLLALRSESFSSIGAYVRTTGIKVTELSVAHLAGPYSWRAVHAVGHAVLTNKTPMGTYRGPGEVEPTFARERMVDEIARELGLDPALVRERSLARDRYEPSASSAMPLIDEAGQRAAPGRFQSVLERARYSQHRLGKKPAGESGDLYGIGIACYQDEGGYGPYEVARVIAEPDGFFTILVGVASSGQGVKTTLGQIFAETIGIEPDRVSVNHHDTDVIPEGFGAFASRTTVVAGNAVALAAEDLRRNARERGAALFGVAESEVIISGDEVTERNGAQSTSMGQMELEGLGRFDREGIDVSFGIGVATVRVDRSTGQVVALRYVVGCDVGRAVNPAIVEGQIVGAAAQGVGGALLEELPYDENGQPLATSFMDYLMPTLSELPFIDAFAFEDGANNALGVKGAGEAGIIGVAAAMGNAVADALGDQGRALTTLPLSPERVLSLTKSHRQPNASRPGEC
ncbi:MAG: molybdopterin-dependent oxidoreductase [Actinobacteria bacterium]|nr:molybdopterin-dependent oxidoreductase [Actinomycetota bacterium]